MAAGPAADPEGDHGALLPQRLLEADTILITIPLKPNRQLADSLKDAAPEVHVLGDCIKPGLIMDAVADGYVTGKAV